MYHCRQMTLDDLKSMTFRVANCYRSIFSIELIQMKIQELIHSNILKYSDENTSIVDVSNESNEKISELINLCIPYLSKLKNPENQPKYKVRCVFLMLIWSGFRMEQYNIVIIHFKPKV